jgi:uncharacterized protein YcbK (DUF882 family)
MFPFASGPGLASPLAARRIVRWGGALLALAAATIAPVYAEAADIVHVVAKGQTLVRIARRYHTSVEAIREVNGLRPGQLLKPGLTLVIPEKGKEAEAAKKAAALHRKAEGGHDAGKGGKAGEGSKGDKGEGGKKKKEAKGSASDQGTKPEPYVHKPKRPGFVRMVRGSEKLETQFLTRHGRLVPSALAGLSRIMRHYPSNSKTPIDPRLATLIGMVSDHFGGRPLHVVSGFRPVTPTQYTKHSNHNIGRALDFTIDGVPNTVLRDYCRTFRNAGVGYYPNSTFVHLDVRSTKVYWVDYSRAGEAPRYDSPVAQASADESTGDVDSTSSGGGSGQPTTPESKSDTPPPPPAPAQAPGDGSGEPHPPPPQPTDPQ